jgi:hypothetical protein
MGNSQNGWKVQVSPEKETVANQKNKSLGGKEAGARRRGKGRNRRNV